MREKSGRWVIRLTCTETAMNYFLDMYEDFSCLGLKSRYSYFMYLYLKSNSSAASCEIELKELKQLLDCSDKEMYADFKRFNDLVLKKTHKDIVENTNLRFSYDLIRKGRFVNAIRFNIEPEDTNNSPELAEQTTEKTGEEKND